MTTPLTTSVAVDQPLVRLTLPRGDLDAAVVALNSAITQLMSARAVQWQSVAASHYRNQVDGAIREVRRVRELAAIADDDWARLRQVAAANGMWG